MTELEKFIEENKFYQTFDFGEGTIIKSAFNSPAEFEKLGLPVDMKGMTYLDIGSNAGFFVMAARKLRGADRAIGVDKVKMQVLKASRLAAILKIDHVEFIHADIERHVFQGGADYVTLLSVFHHLRFPISTMKQIRRLVKNTLIAEIWTAESGERSMAHVPERIDRDGYWLPTRAAAKEILINSGFRSVDECGPGKTKDRILFRASG